MAGWTINPMAGEQQTTASDGWTINPLEPSKTPDATKVDGWTINPVHPAMFQGPQKRIVDLSTSFPRVQRMIDMLQSGTAQFAEAGGGLLEAHGPAALQDTGQHIREEAGKYTAPTMPVERLGAGWEKLKGGGVENAVKWLGDTASNIPEFLAENVLSQVPQMAANMAGGYVGGTLGAVAGAMGGPAGVATGVRAGSLAGMGAVNYFLNAGETFSNLRELGVSREAAAEAAGITGAGKAILDTALPAKLVGSLAGKLGMTTFWVPKSVAATAPKLWKAVLSGIGIEGTTEAGQELLDVWAEMQKGVGTPDKTISRVLNAAASGAAGGGVFGGAEHIAERLAAKKEMDATPDPDMNPNAPPEPAEPTLPVNPTLPGMPRPELPPPVPGTISETDVPKHIQDKVVGLSGQEGLFKAYDEAEMKTILGMDESVSLAPALRQGLVMRDGEQYRLTEMATGVAPVEPVTGMPGMWRSIEQPYSKTFQYVAEADPSQRFTIDYTPGDPAAGTEDIFATVHEGQPLTAPTLDEIKEQIDAQIPGSASIIIPREIESMASQRPGPIVTRVGEIRPDDQGGAYFAMPGSSYQEALSAKKYNLGATRILESREPEIRTQLLQEILKDPRLKPEDVAEVQSQLENLTDSGDPLDYMFVDGFQAPLVDAARRMGYDAITVGENDDYPGQATSLYAWNTGKIQPHGKPRVESMASQPGRITTGTTQLSVDPGEIIKILRKSMYQSARSKSMVKETLQNSLDAIRDNNGEVMVEIDTSDTESMPGEKRDYIEVSDTGSGMSLDTIQNAYSTFGKPSDKRTSKNASGGFGIAMAAIFAAGERMIVETTYQHPNGSYEVTKFDTTPDDVYSTGFNHTTEYYDADENLQTGTRTRVYFDAGALYDAREFVKNLKFSANLPGKVTVTDRQNNYSAPKVTVHLPGQKQSFTHVLQEEMPGVADLGFYGSPDKIEDPKGGYLPVHILNRGLYQFDISVQVKSALGIPRELTVDVGAQVEPTNDKYPFTANRESLANGVEEKISDIIEKELINPARQKTSDTLLHKYVSLPAFGGVTPHGLQPTALFDNGGRLTPEEQKLIMTDPVVKKFMSALGKTVLNMQAWVRDNGGLWRTLSGTQQLLGQNIERVGLLVNDPASGYTGGVWVPKPGTSKASIFINPYWIIDSVEQGAGDQPTISGEGNDWDVYDPNGAEYRDRYKSFNNEAAARAHYESVRVKVSISGDQYAGGIMHVIAHEFLHDVYHGGWDSHGAAFCWGMGGLYGVAGNKYNEWLKEISNALTEPAPGGGTQIHSGLQRTLSIYREARQRPATEADILGGESTRGGVDPERTSRYGGGPGTGGTPVGSGGGSSFASAPSPTPVPPSDSSATRGLKVLNKMLRNIPREEGDKFRDIFGIQSKLLRHALSTTQLYDMVQRDPNWRFLAPTVKQFLDWSIKRKMEKNRVQLEADKVNRVWQKPGRKTGKSIDTLVQTVAERSTELGRRLTEQEIVAMARPLAGDTGVLLEAWKTVDGSMQKALVMLEDALVEEANRTLGLTAPGHIAEIRKQIDQLRHRNYFPSTRFGNYGVLVKSNSNQIHEGKHYHANQTVIFETRELESHGQDLARELQAEWPSDKFTVTPRLITPVEQSFMNMPESLADYLKDHLDLSPQQFEDLKALQYQLAPGQGMVKHLIKKKGILGASRDSLRVYNDYYQKLSGHIAKIKTSGPMEKTIAEAKKLARTYSNDYKPQLIAETLERSYQDMQSVRNEWGAVAGGVFHTVFSFVPLAAIVNMTQVPVMTYPYLAKRSNDLVATGALARAVAKVGPTMDPRKTPTERNAIYTGEDKVFFDRAVDEAFLEESLAGEIAAMASSNMLTKYFEGGVQFAQQLRWFMGKSIMFQKIAEEFNRRVTFHAALEVGRTKGLAGENLFDFARTAVQMTQFEYASWNRPRIMRGNKAVLFIFKTYLQNFMYFAKTNQGGMRFWLMLIAIGGLRAAPGADDILDTIDMLGTWAKTFFGWKNPRVDAQRAAREFISSVGANPDLLMNGLARYSFGMTGLNTLFGIPFPSVDFSASVQMTRIVPGMRMVKGMSQGTMKWSDAFLTAANDVFGAAGSMGMNLTRAVLDDTPNSSSKLVNMTQVSKNTSRALDMATSGAYRDNDGTKLVDVDLTKPEHIGEIIMQAMGKRPTRVSQKLEAGYADREQAAFYYARREIIITHWATAIGERDTDAREDARKEWVKFAKTAPTEFILPVDQLRAELRQRVEKRTLKNMGLAPQKRLIPMRKETESLYQSPFQGKGTP